MCVEIENIYILHSGIMGEYLNHHDKYKSNIL